MFFASLFSLALLAAETEIQSPASDATIDAFVAVIPPAKPVEFGMLPYIGESLEKRNPGRGKDIEAFIARQRECLTRNYNEFVVQMVRSAVRPLGDVKLRKMTELYKSGDAASLGLFDKDRDSLTETEKSTVDRIKDTYPVDDYYKSMKQVFETMLREDGYLNAMSECDRQWDSEKARLGLKGFDAP